MHLTFLGSPSGILCSCPCGLGLSMVTLCGPYIAQGDHLGNISAHLSSCWIERQCRDCAKKRFQLNAVDFKYFGRSF